MYPDISAELTSLLPGRNAAVYRLTDGGINFLLLGQSGSNGQFISSIDVSDIFPVTAEPTAEKISSIAAEGVADKLLPGAKASTRGDMISLSALYFSGIMIGLLTSSVSSDFDRQSVDSDSQLELAAQILAMILGRNRELRRLKQSNSFYQNLMAASTEIDITATAEDALSGLTKAVMSALSFDRLTISMRHAKSDETLVVVHASGAGPGLSEDQEFGPKSSYHGEVVLTNSDIFANDMSDQRFLGRFIKGDNASDQMKSFIGVPIVEAGVAVGVIAVEGVEKGRFSEEDRQKLIAVSRIYGPPLRWSARYQEVHSLATVDGLTSLVNSRSFLQRMNEELERDVRYGSEMSMLMLDIDNFKSVNDTHGHQYGDYVIKQTAKLIRKSIRIADVAGRLGGEEFGVIIINADSVMSRKTAERIKQSIADYQFSNDGIKNKITISVGMSEYPIDGRSVKEIMKHADDAMYAVKHGGGNGVKTYSEL